MSKITTAALAAFALAGAASAQMSGTSMGSSGMQGNAMNSNVPDTNLPTSAAQGTEQSMRQRDMSKKAHSGMHGKRMNGSSSSMNAMGNSSSTGNGMSPQPQ